ncbi:MAG TPA: XrtA system polysaccharide deacetylase [Planctomycetota bacterium]|nr:XrtA system polysaccharide deacetylase [Planctomycetota bacterium]
MTRLHAVSFDVEEHFQVANFAGVVDRADWEKHGSRVEANVDRILDLLARAKTRATFFWLGWVAERHLGCLRKVADAGHEIGSHGYDHRFVHDLGESGFRADVRRTKAILEDACGRPVAGFRASTFTITRRTPWALAVLAEEGHRYDASIFPVRHPAYGIPDAPREMRIERPGPGLAIVEFPPLTMRFAGRNWPAGGGGYFRLFPLAVTALAFARAEREGLSGSLYLHPWEFDPGQPHIEAGRLSSFRHRVNLARTEPRLERLLARFRFGTMREAIEASLGPTSLAPSGPA